MGVHRIAQQAVFLDRDGVINRAIVRNGRPYPPSSLAELEILPAVSVALAKLRGVGFRLIVVTNQPEVARGLQTREHVESLHAALRTQLPLDEIKTCYHDDNDRCSCRKPAPGMLLAAAQELDLDLSMSFMVGDRWRDIEAGQRAGCTSLFVDYNYAESRPTQPYVCVKSLLEAADWILAREISERYKRQ